MKRTTLFQISTSAECASLKNKLIFWRILSGVLALSLLLICLVAIF